MMCTGDHKAVGFFSCFDSHVYGKSLCLHKDVNVTKHQVQKMGATLAMGFPSMVDFDSDMQQLLVEAFAEALDVPHTEFTQFETSEPPRNASTNGTSPATAKKPASNGRRLAVCGNYSKHIKYQVVIPPGSTPEMLQKAEELLSQGPAWDRMMAKLRNDGKFPEALSNICLQSIVPHVVFDDEVARFQNGALVKDNPAATIQNVPGEPETSWFTWWLVVAASILLLFSICFCLYWRVLKWEKYKEPSAPKVDSFGNEENPEEPQTSKDTGLPSAAPQKTEWWDLCEWREPLPSPAVPGDGNLSSGVGFPYYFDCVTSIEEASTRRPPGGGFFGCAAGICAEKASPPPPLTPSPPVRRVVFKF